MENIKRQESIEDKISKLRARKKALSDKDLFGFHEESTEHARMVEKSYKEQNKNARQFKTFHMLIGSTTDDAYSPYYDFPEPEYSIEKFIEKKEKEYESK
jgi:hypothetical protein